MACKVLLLTRSHQTGVKPRLPLLHFHLTRVVSNVPGTQRLAKEHLQGEARIAFIEGGGKPLVPYLGLTSA